MPNRFTEVSLPLLELHFVLIFPSSISLRLLYIRAIFVELVGIKLTVRVSKSGTVAICISQPS